MSHMLLMSFDDTSVKDLMITLSRFYEYMFDLVQKQKDINFCFIGTARNDKLIDYLFFSGFMHFKFGNRVHTSKLDLTKRDLTPQQLEEYISKQDIIFVGGGNTEEMLSIWERKGFTAVLNKLRRADRLPILAGVSAGGVYPFASGLSDSIPGQYTCSPCLGWFRESFCPHADSKVVARCEFDGNAYLKRMPAYQEAVRLGVLPPGFAVPNNCMLHLYNDKLVKVLSAGDNINCYFVTPTETRPIETFNLTRKNSRQTVQNLIWNLHLNRNNNSYENQPIHTPQFRLAH